MDAAKIAEDTFKYNGNPMIAFIFMTDGYGDYP